MTTIAINRMATFTVVDGVGVIAIDNPPVNAMSQGVREGIVKGIELAARDDSVSAVLLHCGGKTFIAGGDITEFGAPLKDPGVGAALAALEDSPKPVVAALHGTAYGGGLELALACNYRVIDARGRCGLPEVNLGLLPVGGGTQRLPRVVSVETALQMAALGEPIGAQKALDEGLVSEIITGDLLAGAIKFSKGIVPQGPNWPKARNQVDKVQPARASTATFEKYRALVGRKKRGFEAPQAIIRCIEAAVELPFDEGIKVEQKEFFGLVKGPQPAALNHMFFAERQAAKVAGIPKDTKTLPISKVGIVGSGTMGGGIAMAVANAGMPVTVMERDSTALDRGLSTIRKNYDNSVKGGRITSSEAESRRALISGSLEMADLADCDLIIEAVFEDMSIKEDVFRSLDRIARPGAILASNTSELDINKIAAVTKRPDAVIGMHFFSPANVMQLLEVVRGDKTGNETIQTCMTFAKVIGKTPVLVGVCPGFVGNRILNARTHQSNELMFEGASPSQIDQVLYDFGMPMGPFAMYDLAGLDLGWNAQKSSSSTVAEVLCENGRRGQKTNAGFYDYDERRNRSRSEVAERLVRDFVEKTGGRRLREISSEEILERCNYSMINEGARILEEGIAARAGDIDVIWVYGYGWPKYLGGPMYYADAVGLPHVLDRIRHYHQLTGDSRWEPSPLLVRLAEQGRKFTG